MITNNATLQRYVLLILLIPSLINFSCSSAYAPSSEPASTGLFKAEKATDERTFVVMKDGSIIEGDKSFAPEGLLQKKVVRLDGKPIAYDQVVAFQNKGTYYAKTQDGFAKRLISGRISVYRRYVTGPGGANAYADYYQKENGAFELMGMEGVKMLLKDCQKAYDMVNISVSEHNKIIRKQPYFVQSVIEIYNNCGEWK